jgi:hypothetical protein
MLRPVLLGLAAAALLAGFGPALRAQEFSANLVMKSNGVPLAQKLYVSNGKIRRDMGALGGSIDDVKQHIGYMLVMGMAFELKGPAREAMLFHLDPNDPCKTFRDMARGKGDLDCTRVGREIVNGRPTVKYQTISAKTGEIDFTWVDLGLRSVVKMEPKTDRMELRNTMELRNIVEGPQPSSLFVVPADQVMLTPKD